MEKNFINKYFLEINHQLSKLSEKNFKNFVQLLKNIKKKIKK